ncbi:MAG: hypothetical protein F4087_05435 [Gemmatimonadetes bacterium]|nr:hypothetical protein [Gemmatimonadota bacterium]MDE2870205.1 hypothetical protein [Gemmatimonadota bacterium]MYA15394.1 hypothetical protein [Gammaproteobacteria bacterium]MYJ67944.1 hypothetical protein [Gemmatimonadota bacterium]
MKHPTVALRPMLSPARLLMVGALLVAAIVVPRADQALAGERQCYWTPGEDPPNSCNECKKTCLGWPFKCCDIVVGE